MLSEHINKLKINVKRNNWSIDEWFSCELNQTQFFIPKLIFVDAFSRKKMVCGGVKIIRCHEETQVVTKEETRTGVKIL